MSAQQQPAPAASGAPPTGMAALDTTPLPDAGGTGGGASTGVVATGDFVRMVVVLAAVLGAIYLLFRLLRRGAAHRLGNSDLIAVLGSRSLGGNRNLHLIRAGRGYYLVGAGDQAVNLVAEITDPDSVHLLAAQEERAGHGQVSPSRFADLLAEAGIGSPSNERTPAAGHVSFLRQQRDRLRRLGGQVREDEVRAAP